MIVGIPKEITKDETRVAIIPSTVASLKKAGLEVIIEKGAGTTSYYSDSEYKEAGATIEKDTESVFGKSDILLKVRPFTENKKLNKHEADLIKEGAAVISLMDAYFHVDDVKKLASRNITSFGMEFIPRITRAQSMDVLSSMAAIAGYQAVLEAALIAPRYFPMLMTAAGSIRPAKVFIIGAGVAGLMAIATARRLGAVVEAYDTRPVVKEQVESLGAKFVEFNLDIADAQDSGGYAKAQSDEFYKKQQEQMASKVSSVDVVITTAAIPGKKAPVLITGDMVKQMKSGSVVVDLAAERGGNVEGTQANKVVVKHGVKIVGYTNYPAKNSVHASQLYSKNISTFLLNMVEEGALNLNMEDEIVSGSMVTHEGKIVHEALNAFIEESSEK